MHHESWNVLDDQMCSIPRKSFLLRDVFLYQDMEYPLPVKGSKSLHLSFKIIFITVFESQI